LPQRRDLEGARRTLLAAATHGRRLRGRAIHPGIDGAELLRRPARPRRRGIPEVRLKDKVAIVTGAGQTPGDTIGNGRATAMLFAREGARVMLIDRRADSARETEAMIAAEGGAATVFEADVTREEDCRAMTDACLQQ